MKCNNCQTPIPPTFTKALQDNLCPACGKSIMSVALNTEFVSIKEKLADADVDEATLVKVAALIAGKYDLLPRGAGAAARSGMPLSRPKTRTQMQDEEIDRELMVEYPHLKDLPDDERRKEIMALRAEADREFGLSKGDPNVIKAPKTAVSDSHDLAAAMNSLMPPNTPVFGDLDGGKLDADTIQRMEKLAALRANPNINKFRRSDG